MTRRGVTLVELLVVLVILGISAGMTGLALGVLSRPEDPVPLRVAQARERAARTGRQLVVPVTGADSIVCFPDGSVSGQASGWFVDPWTGEVARAAS